ncbi:MAG TPA: hypothetical protein VFN78_05130 [Ktedonobacterales bacterium]|nr:hypothetical protein [Ktedonobacterales bacterium]
MLQQVCPHCGSALPALAIETTPLRCPTCGAALSDREEPSVLPVREAVYRDERSVDSLAGVGEEDDSATRVAAQDEMAPALVWAHADHEQRQRTSASDGAAETPETTQALPLSALPPEARDPMVTHPSIPPMPSGEWDQHEQGQRRATPGLRTLSLGLAALVLIAVVVVAALAANGVIGAATTAVAATATSAPTATPAVKPFSPANLYQVSYPQDWTVTQRNPPPSSSTSASYFALLSAPRGDVSVNIAAQQVSPTPALTALDQAFLIKLSKPGTTPSVTGSPTSVTVGGQAWTQLAADVTLAPAPGQPTYYAHVIALSTTRGDYAYTIVCVAASPSAAAAGPAFTTADQAYFQPLLASFQFLR